MNEGDGLGMKVPCELVFNGHFEFKCLLTDFLFSYIERFLRSVEIQH